jgi:di/tricarboxylate transporter
MSTQQMVFLFILAGALALFMRGRLRVDITALLVLLSLVIAGILAPAEALAGFSSDPAIIVASVFVLSAALSATGLTDRIGKWIGGAAGDSEARAILVVMPTVAVLAAFSHHLMITAMMLPIILGFARERKMAASRLLMPMSLAASLGTTLTLFSAPAFLLSSDLLLRQTGTALDVFSITPIGVVLVIVGVAYMLLMRWILPRRTGAASEQDYLRLDQYYTELVVEEKSPWSGERVEAFRTRFKDRLQLVNRLRNGAPLQHDDLPLEARDVLLVRASPDEISSVVDEPGLALNALAKYGDSAAQDTASGGDGQLVQVVVGPNSEFIDRTIGNIDFFRNLGVLVVGLWRQDGWLDEEISEVNLRAGDLLVLLGSPDDGAVRVEAAPAPSRTRRARHHVAGRRMRRDGLVLDPDRFSRRRRGDDRDAMCRCEAGLQRDRRQYLRHDRRGHPARNRHGENGHRRAAGTATAGGVSRLERAGIARGDVRRSSPDHTGSVRCSHRRASGSGCDRSGSRTRTAG